jgi:hypothetical protein
VNREAALLCYVLSMARIYHFPKTQVLGPDDLRLAADAFEAALLTIHENTCESPARTTRRLLAQYVIEHALTGERDFEALRNGALGYVNSITIPHTP